MVIYFKKEDNMRKTNTKKSMVHSEHGMTDIVNCCWYLKEKATVTSRITQLNEMNQVKILIYKGKTVKVYCQYLDDKKCTGQGKPLDKELCYLLK